jgi:hypothetical protein
MGIINTKLMYQLIMLNHMMRKTKRLGTLLKNWCQQPPGLSNHFAYRMAHYLLLIMHRLLHARDEINTERLILRTYIRPDLELLRLHGHDNQRVFDLTVLVPEINHGSV